jgi:hypothetical protein
MSEQEKVQLVDLEEMIEKQEVTTQPSQTPHGCTWPRTWCPDTLW